MPTEIEEFHHEMCQSVYRAADANGEFIEDAFFEKFCAPLCEVGELVTADRAPYLGARGIRVDGYGGDIGSDGVLSLIICDFDQSAEISGLNATQMDQIFRRLWNFLNSSLKEEFRNGLEESSFAFGLADLIDSRWNMINGVNLILVSNRRLSRRVDGLPAAEIDGVPVTYNSSNYDWLPQSPYNVWDIERLHRYEMSGGVREDMVIDLSDFGGPIAVLPATTNQSEYEAYLAVVPGKQLVAIYTKWRARLLEQNVRLFLQFRGRVNRGIRTTLENDPSLFFAYNNGITATAEHVELQRSEDGIYIKSLTNFQIVNGGQTTASLFAASRNKNVDLDRVYLQMKLAIIEPSLALNLVPNISRFANSQNGVSDADFFSNHEFHIRFEQMSRRVLAPSLDGIRESKWFYERARGQHQEARAYLTPALRRQFDAEYPKNQLVTKTDLGKFLNVWKGKPDLVSKGAQINFSAFAEDTKKDWESNPDNFNDVYYRESIAKAIVFKEVEKLVTKQPWYEGGYRANVVAYAIAKLGREVDRIGASLDFEEIWRTQKISDGLREMLTISAKAVHGVITNPPASTGNVTEWAKRRACWERVEKHEIAWPEPLESYCITKGQKSDLMKSGVTDQKLMNGIEAQTIVVGIAREIWMQLRNWGLDRGILTPPEDNALKLAAFALVKVPSERHCQLAIATMRKLHQEGCPISSGPSDEQSPV